MHKVNMVMTFEDELKELLKKYDDKNEFKTPDFLLFNYICNCLSMWIGITDNIFLSGKYSVVMKERLWNRSDMNNLTGVKK
jgi:hypothetical protein